MSLSTRAGLLAGAAALTLTGVGAANAGADGNQDQIIKELQQRVAELEAQNNNDNWLTEQRAAEVRSLVQDVLADADTRASLLGSGMQAGYDNGFQIGDTTGNFLLQINGQLQVRWMYSYQSDPPDELFFGPIAGVPAAPGDRHRSGFENTRTKLWFTGHVINPSWRYHIEGDFGVARGVDTFGFFPDDFFDSSGTFTLLDAWIAHEYGDTGWVATVGQFKLPFLREELVDSRYQQAVERSIFNSLFTTGRSQGVMASYEQDMFRIFGAFSDGANQANTSALDYTTEFALTGRAEFLGAGNWGQFNEFRSHPDEEFALLLGVAGHWEDGEYGTLDVETEVLRLTADAHAKFGGWNLYGALIWNHEDTKAGGGNFTDYGFLAQGGFHLTPEWELFGRWEYADIEEGGILSVATAGFNYYLFNAGHSAKWTTDFGYGLHPVVGADPRTGWRADAEGEDGQFVVRTQLQLAF